mmetsp:Transcript_19735/g.45976  ORF Transcript_19735/g.45976 Transcript_19735/m.45976 type:complete len:244 (+) Transcript_19735:98-829(+)
MPPAAETLEAVGNVETADAQSPPVFGAFAREAELKKINFELRRCANTTKDVTQEMLAIDNKVWELQREHMRLVRIHEEQRAGKVLLDLDDQIRKEQQELVQQKAKEKELTRLIEERKLRVQELQDKRGYLLKGLESAQVAEVQVAEEATTLVAEIEEATQNLQVAEAAKVEAQQVLQEREVMRDESSDRLASLRAELEEAKRATAEAKEDLRLAKAEYRGWQRDKEAAVELTAKAMGVLSQEE